MMDITKSREDFEAWAEKNGYRMDLIPNSDIYSYSSTRCSWEAWQASREIIVLDLPEPGDYDYITQYAESVYMEIRTAGIRIKGESE